MARVTLSDVKTAHPEWFSRGNKKFFGDTGYRLLHGKKTHKPYLVRSTCGWSDMFNQPKRCFFAINPIGPDLKIEPLVKKTTDPAIPKEFSDIGHVKDWLAEH